MYRKVSYTNIYKHILYFSSIIGYYKILSRVPSAILLYFNTKVEAAQSCLTVTPWTVAYQAILSVEFSRQEYCSGLPCPLPGDIPNQGIKPMSLTSPALAGRFFTTSAAWKAQEM